MRAGGIVQGTIGLWFLVCTSAAVVHAESVPREPCNGSWWTIATDPPRHIAFRSASPTVAVGAVWNKVTATAGLTELEALSVEVTDEHGRRIDGDLGVGFENGPWTEAPLSYTGRGQDDRLAQNAWWRPRAGLASGAYTMRTTIPAPVGEEFRGCSYFNYVTDIEFEIAPELLEPRLEVSHSLTAEPSEYVTHSTECDERGEIAYCPSARDICCWFNPGYTHTVEFEWTNLPPGWSFYHVLEIEYDLIGYPYDKEHLLWHPFPHLWENSESYRLTQAFNPAPWQLPLPAEFCARGRVLDIVSGAPSLQFSGCVVTAEATEVSQRPLECNLDVCAELSGGPKPADSSPEEADAVEPQESELADPSAEGATASDVADPGADGFGGCTNSGGREALVGYIFFVLSLVSNRWGRARRAEI